jgi:hypothetical protein
MDQSHFNIHWLHGSGKSGGSDCGTSRGHDGAVTNNMAIVPATTGSISVFPSAPTHLVLDLFGFVAP